MASLRSFLHEVLLVWRYLIHCNGFIYESIELLARHPSHQSARFHCYNALYCIVEWMLLIRALHYSYAVYVNMPFTISRYDFAWNVFVHTTAQDPLIALCVALVFFFS